MLGLKRGTVKLVSYDRNWSKEFERERSRLLNILGGNVISIEHIGSTAIPRLRAKPLIDILVGVKTIKKEGKKCLNLMSKKRGYHNRPKYFPKHRFLLAKGDGYTVTHYLHIVKYKGRAWNRSILFRDYLTSHKDEARRYVNLKESLASKYRNNRDMYTKSKMSYIDSVVAKARQ